ncbi:LOW QUALITY PROTEIN: hypothetical protein SORBI_3002G073400 [Sorghum bicolor]|uniref:Uncharacterized protein n=3 Tax=Sorghum bicolor TaxID=4558 RepID=A0A1W0W2Q2_SORBI|nr:LOW QUALITY PROTEIN: hypothetical protein SORBI_3002G073400 [Sorghum bicolor]
MAAWWSGEDQRQRWLFLRANDMVDPSSPPGPSAASLFPTRRVHQPPRRRRTSGSGGFSASSPMPRGTAPWTSAFCDTVSTCSDRRLASCGGSVPDSDRLARTLSCCRREDERLDAGGSANAATALGFLKQPTRNRARSSGSANDLQQRGPPPATS